MKRGDLVAGKYRLDHVIGRGGMATVWSATNAFTDRRFAIKFLLPEVARTPEAARRLMLEAKVSARINHPNIVEVFDVGQCEDGALFLVMELLSGESLEEALRAEHLSIHEFLVILREVARALSTAHGRGVIHRDLKPSNIFLHKDRDGRLVPKVLDFGVSKVLGADGDASLTVVGTILGSPLYMSPEQAMGSEHIDPRTDVFAFGAVLFEGLCGERPYSATNLNALIVAIATTPPKSIDWLAPFLPEPLRALVRECLIKDREQRLQSLDLVRQRLDALVELLAGSPLRLPPPKPGESSASHASQGLFAVRSDEMQPSSRRATSVAPLSFPTPRAPAAMAIGAAQPGRARRMGALALGGCAVLGVVTLASVLGAPMLRVSRSALAHATAPLAAEPATAPPAPSPAPAPSVDRAPTEAPVVAVDSLPHAKNATPTGKHTGRLTVASLPTSCILSIDGVVHGPTPMTGLPVAAGAHKLECVAAGGKSASAAVDVAEGSDAHYQFALTQ